MKKIAVVGTQGVPASYGGFETLIENIIGGHCSSGLSYTVFCSSKDMPQKQKSYKGAELKYVPWHANGIQSILYDIVCLLRAMFGYDVILILGTSGCVFLPVFRLFCRGRVIVNIDGLEHRREKWGPAAQRFLLLSEAVAVRFAHVIVADNKGIQDYVREVYRKEAELIAYGGDHVLRQIPGQQEQSILKRYDLSSGNYAMTVCRIEPENNCHLILDAFSRVDRRLVFIGNWNRNDYGKSLRQKYLPFDNITMPDPIYDLDILYVLRKNSGSYIHGHSAGGTNPSLVEAMFCGCNIIAYDVVYNRQTTEGDAHYFCDGEELARLLRGEEPCEDNSRTMLEIAERRYNWAAIARQYEMLY